jgi:hypothetical protein
MVLASPSCIKWQRHFLNSGAMCQTAICSARLHSIYSLSLLIKARKAAESSDFSTTIASCMGNGAFFLQS